MLVYTDSSTNADKSNPKLAMKLIHNSHSKATTSKKKTKCLSKKNINFLNSIGLVIKKR